MAKSPSYLNVERVDATTGAVTRMSRYVAVKTIILERRAAGMATTEYAAVDFLRTDAGVTTPKARYRMVR